MSAESLGDDRAHTPLPTRSVIGRGLLLLLALVSCGAAQGPLRAQSTVADRNVAERGAVTERISVHEGTVLVEFPNLSPSSIRALVGDDFTVVEGGAPRRVVRVDRIDDLPGDGAPWHVLVYVDAQLGAKETIELGAMALAKRAAKLTALGPVRVVVDDGAVRELQSATTSDSIVATTLSRLSRRELGATRIDDHRRAFRRLRREGGLAVAEREQLALRYLETELDLVERQADRILTEMMVTCPYPPCLLIYLSDGFYLQPGGFYFDDEHIPPVAARAQRASDLLAQGLSAMGTAAVALVLRPPEPPPPPDRRPMDTFETFRSSTSGGAPMGPSRNGRNRFSFKTVNAFDLFVDPAAEPLREIAAATTGAALRLEDQLDEELKRVRRHALLRFETEASTWGDFRPVEVAFREESSFQSRRELSVRLGFATEEERLRAATTSRAGEPPQLAASLARRLHRAGEDSQRLLTALQPAGPTLDLLLEIDSPTDPRSLVVRRGSDLVSELRLRITVVTDLSASSRPPTNAAAMRAGPSAGGAEVAAEQLVWWQVRGELVEGQERTTGTEANGWLIPLAGSVELGQRADGTQSPTTILVEDVVSSSKWLVRLGDSGRARPVRR